MSGVLDLAHTNVPPKISPFKVCPRVFVLNEFSINYQALVCIFLMKYMQFLDCCLKSAWAS